MNFLGMGIPEIGVILLVAFLVLGPGRSIDMVRSAGKIMGDLLQMAPSLSEAQLVQQTACLRPLSGDGMPIVGGAPGWANLYIGTGAGRKGILWSTGMSFGLSELILNGKTSVPGIEHLDPARFKAS